MLKVICFGKVGLECGVVRGQCHCKLVFSIIWMIKYSSGCIIRQRWPINNVFWKIVPQFDC